MTSGLFLWNLDLIKEKFLSEAFYMCWLSLVRPCFHNSTGYDSFSQHKKSKICLRTLTHGKIGNSPAPGWIWTHSLWPRTTADICARKFLLKNIQKKKIANDVLTKTFFTYLMIISFKPVLSQTERLEALFWQCYIISIDALHGRT